MDKNSYKKVVVVFLHENFDSYLLQLRDFKPSIIYPGHWGVFGGAVEEGESPRTAIGRELTEEIGYSPETFELYGDVYKDEDKLHIHMFYSNMGVPLSSLLLMEGADLGMFTKEEILTSNLYSKTVGKTYPVVPLLLDLFNDFFEYVDKNIRAL